MKDVDIDAREQLENYARTLLGINVKYRNQHTLILGELDALSFEQNKEVSLLIRRTIESLYPSLLEINPTLQKHMYFPTAMMFVGMINWTHTWFDGSGDVSVEGFAKLLCTTFLDGFSKS